MSINNREDANKYYQVINSLVDEYTEKHKIRPSNLKRYGYQAQVEILLELYSGGIIS